MYPQLNVPVSYAGILSMLISVGTVVSSLLCDRLLRKLGAGKLTALSTLLTALALIGFSVSDSFWLLCLLTIPYGLGAGSVDAALNNYVAVNYSSRHMSWLHCMWGVGAAIGPYIMGIALSGGHGWEAGYVYVAVIQIVLTAVLFISLPMWKKQIAEQAQTEKPLSLLQIFRIPGAKQILTAFFCYCSVEQTAALWASSYLTLFKGVAPETAAFFSGLFYLGITLGRFFNGFLTMKFSDAALIRAGNAIILVGIAAMLLPLGQIASLAGLLLIGLGCAPVYPCIIHSTPELFGEENSQALIGVQMASAYLGVCLMPTLFGLVARHITVALLPVFLLALTALMILMYEQMRKRTSNNVIRGGQ